MEMFILILLGLASFGLTSVVINVIVETIRLVLRLRRAVRGEVTFEVEKPDGQVKQVTVNPDDEASIRRFLDTVGAGELAAR